MNGLEKLNKLYCEAQRRMSEYKYRKWLVYCLGVMSSKMDKLDFETMQEGIKKYEV